MIYHLQEKLQTLQRNRWINPGTAWLRADFVFYNSNVNRFGFVKFTWEFKSSGSILSSFEVCFGGMAHIRQARPD